MKIWAITYGDGYEFSGVIVEAYDNEAEADNRATELQEKHDKRRGKFSYGGYSVEEFELNARDEKLET